MLEPPLLQTGEAAFTFVPGKSVYWEEVGHKCLMSSRRSEGYFKRKVDGKTACTVVTRLLQIY